MKDRTSNRLAYAVSLFEIIVGGITSWIIGKLLDFTWRYFRKNLDSENDENPFLRCANILIRLLALVSDLHPAEIKFSMHANYEKFDHFRGFLKSFAEIYAYALRKP